MLDLIVRNGTVIDGSGRPGERADVAVDGDRIVAIGGQATLAAKQVIDVAGLVVCPGFVDTHNHAYDEHNGGILAIPHADNLIRQGITTILSGACGGSGYPVGEHLARVAALKCHSNYVAMCGYSTVKSKVVPGIARNPTAAETREIAARLREAMAEGAFGVTTGILGHSFEKTSTEEIIAAARAVAPAGGIYHSHIRDEGEWGRHLEALREVVRIGREGGLPALSSHLKLWGRLAWGQTAQVDAIFAETEREKLDVHADMYGYTGGYRGLNGLIQPLKNTMSKEDLSREPALPLVLDTIREQLDLIGGPDHVILCPLTPNPEINGKTLAEVAQARPADGGMAETAYALMVHERPSCCWLAMREEEVEHFLATPYTMIGTDGHLRELHTGHCHPRNYGNYPRILGRYVRERRVLALETAIHKMTQRPARKIGVRRRGLLAPNMFADLVVFDPAAIADRASWADPYQYPAGIVHVIVNGRFAVRDGATTREFPGRVLRRNE